MIDPGEPPSHVTPPGADWFQAEESTRIAMVSELQRIKRRIKVRPLPVLILTALITFGITHKFASKQPLLEASVTLALSEGSMANRYNNIPVDQLRQYVTSVLLPDKELLALIEKRNLFRLRKTLGPQYAIEELRSSLNVQIWKNSFIFFDSEEQSARRSARIGLAVSDSDPDRAFEIAHDLASIVIDQLYKQRQKLAGEISDQVALLRATIEASLTQLGDEIAAKRDEIDEAQRSGQTGIAAGGKLSLVALEREKKTAEDRLNRIAASNEDLTSQIANAGLDMGLSIVEEYRPELPTRSSFVLIMIASVIGAGALLSSALVLGAFDSRVHDSDDITRLGLPVLGHVPGFAGDNVGSMQTRSAARARVPSFLRWRSHR